MSGGGPAVGVAALDGGNARVAWAVDVAASLVGAGFATAAIAQALVDPRVYPALTARELGTVVLDRRVAPDLSRTELRAILRTTPRSEADIAAALDALFPVPGTPGNDAFVLEHGAYLVAPPNAAYDFGLGDFTVTAWVKGASPGTIVGRTAGLQSKQGGWVLRIETIEGRTGVTFLTHDASRAFGFFTPANVLDGRWHHVAGMRKDDWTMVEVDGSAQPGLVLGQPAALDVSNGRQLTLGTADDEHPARAFTGQLAEVTLWNRLLVDFSRTYPQEIEVKSRTRPGPEETGLVGYWSGQFGAPLDLSPTRNTTSASGTLRTSHDGPLPDAPSASPFAGAYATEVKWGGLTGSWRPAGMLYVFSGGIVAYEGVAVPGPALAGTSAHWPSGRHRGRYVITFEASSSEAYYWPEGGEHLDVFEGAYEEGAKRVDVRGRRTA